MEKNPTESDNFKFTYGLPSQFCSTLVDRYLYVNQGYVTHGLERRVDNSPFWITVPYDANRQSLKSKYMQRREFP
ncbi:unnamed protein product [Chondrus crispus]|uniref:Uncharacterized protein n=1 Tax=Chondrus crispus TaxID=2769 RepID=R7QJ64_CHOCR|nr:unnamed protein product [Chondrus crispus]CDF38547.1 unnamed protein product [Chondrus crispus]|eukprot:XP_005718440.1 unnamed protein product [Chondrus crispus]